jgi:hypothetical protein
LPAASLPATSAPGENDRPPSSDRDCSIFVPFAPFVVQTTTMAGSRPARDTSATCGGCSPFSRASPSKEFTRTGAPNARPPSRLTAVKTSVAPPGSVPPQVTATNFPSAAIVGVALPRPLTPNSIGAFAADSDTARTMEPMIGQKASGKHFDRM